MSPTARGYWRGALLVSAGVYLPLLVWHSWCMTGFGGWSIVGSDLFIAPPLVAVVMLPFAAVAACFGRMRSTAATSALLVVLAVPMVRLSYAGRMLGFQWA